ncbi:MAG: HNH endonuclease [Paraclostridium sp.]
MIEYDDYINSYEWKILRRQVIRRDLKRCRNCGTNRKQLHVHHLTYERFGNERLDDLMTLCVDCHRYIHREKDKYANIAPVKNDKREKYEYVNVVSMKNYKRYKDDSKVTPFGIFLSVLLIVTFFISIELYLLLFLLLLFIGYLKSKK